MEITYYYIWIIKIYYLWNIRLLQYYWDAPTNTLLSGHNLGIIPVWSNENLLLYSAFPSGKHEQ